MQNNAETSSSWVVYKKIDKTQPTLPQRSLLYNLEPLGLGSGKVESLISYFSRLADAHSLSIANLFYRLVKAKMTELVSAVSGDTKTNPLSSLRIYKLQPANGSGITANFLSQALGNLTSRLDLHLLTFIPWSNFISKDNLTRTSRAWCPVCLEEWKITNSPIKELLIWSLRDLEICPYHKCQLEKICSSCNKEVKIVWSNHCVGHCSECFAWLGHSYLATQQNLDIPETDPYKLWAANELEALLASSKKQVRDSACRNIQTIIKPIINRVFNGNVAELERRTSLPDSSTRKWINGNSIPMLSSLLKLSYKLGITLTNLLNNEINIDALCQQFSRNEIITVGNKKPNTDKNEIEAIIRNALDQNPPISLYKIAKQLGFKSTLPLKEMFPELTQLFKSRLNECIWEQLRNNKHINQKISEKTIRQAFKNALSKDIPPSVDEIARSLGLPHSWFLYRHYSELTSAVASKKTQRREKIINKIKDWLEIALTEFPPIPLLETCKKHGYKNTEFFRYYFPDLCNEVKKRYESYSLELRLKPVRDILEAALIEDPPPSVDVISARVDWHIGEIYKKFPELCKLIVARRAKYRTERSQQKIKEAELKIREIVMEMIERGKYPSTSEIYRQIRYLTPINYIVKAELIKTIKSELAVYLPKKKNY